MKYHSPVSTVIISLVVLLLFASVALFAVFSIGMTSPTLIAADRIMDELESMGGSVSISFDSMERNLRDGVFIHGFSVSYEGEEIIFLDTLTFRMGLFSLIRYAVLGDARLEAEGSGGFIRIPDIENGGSGQGGGTLSLPSFLDNRGISLRVHDVSFSGFGLSSPDLTVSASAGMGRISASVGMESAAYSSAGISAEASSLTAGLTWDGTVTVSASAGSLSAGNEDFSFLLSDAVIRGDIPDDFDLAGASAALSFSSLSASYLGADLSAGAASVSFSLSSAEAVVRDISAAYDGIAAEAGEADIRITDMERAEAALDDVSVTRDGMLLFAAGRIGAAAATDGSITADIPSFASEALSLVLPGFTADEASLSLSADLSGTASAEGTLVLGSDEAVFDGASIAFFASADASGGMLRSVDISLGRISLPGIADTAALHASYGEDSIAVDGSFGSYLSFTGSLAREDAHLRMLLSSMPLESLMPLIMHYAPLARSYISSETAASGSVYIDFSADEGGSFAGPAGFAISLSGIQFSGNSISISASGSGTLEPDAVEISQLSLITDIVRASYTGRIGFRTGLPEGRFTLEMTDSGYELFEGSLTLESDEEYYFSAEIPYFSSSWLRGSVDWSEENLISSSAVLRSGTTYYPFSIIVDTGNNLITLDNDRAHASVSFGEDIEGTLSFDSFHLPLRDDGTASAFLDGTVRADFGFSDQKLSIVSDGFRVGNLSRLPGSPEITFSIRGDNDSLSFTSIRAAAEGFEPLEGSAVIAYGAPSVAISLNAASSESFLLSIVHSSDGMYSGILRADGFDLGRFGAEDMIADVSLSARAGTWEALSFSGNVSAHSRDMINDPVSAEAMIVVDRDDIRISSLSYSTGSLTLTSESIGFSSGTGIASGSVSVSTSLPRADGPLPVSASFGMSVNLHRGDNLAEAISGIAGAGLDGISADIMLNGADIGGMFSIGERNLHLLSSGGNIDVSGSLASGFADLDAGFLSLYIDLMPVAAFALEGNIGKSGSNTELRFTIDSFEISVADLFLDPSVVFYQPSPAHGEIVAVYNGSQWDLFGSISAEEVQFEVFWMPDERVILHNPYFVVWNNHFTSLITDCTVLDLNTYERTPSKVSLDISLSPSLVFEGWDVDVYASEKVGIRLPIEASNIDIVGDVTGYLNVGQGEDGVLYLIGNLAASDLTMSIGMHPIPEWMSNVEGSGRTIADLDLLLTENVKFLLPLTGNPILRADIAENQNLRVRVHESGELDVSGSLDLRSGEIFYFQKNFYITEGNLSFPTDPMASASFNPVLSLRARLRDFDSEGNPVDVYLILRNSTLDSINPSFESSPSKSLSEIMQILGQSILPNSIYGDISLSSMVSLVSASMDILTRIGIIPGPQENTLEQSIRSTLSLDTFSLHTNIFENIIFDTVSYASSNIENESLSPVARYLDGTTLYMGKYLSPELYIEAMMHLAAESNPTETKHTFLSDDLNLDIEVSLEWDNPLAVFTFFTRPQNITVYDILDSFGFGFSKRIVW